MGWEADIAEVIGGLASRWVTTMALKTNIAVARAVIGLAIAALTVAIDPASECSTAQEVHWWIASPFFTLFILAGGYVMTTGCIAQRLTLFVFVGLVIASYVAVLTLSLPMVFETEISCAASGAR